MRFWADQNLQIWPQDCAAPNAHAELSDQPVILGKSYSYAMARMHGVGTAEQSLHG